MYIVAINVSNATSDSISVCRTFERAPSRRAENTNPLARLTTKLTINKLDKSVCFCYLTGRPLALCRQTSEPGDSYLTDENDERKKNEIHSCKRINNK